MFRFPLPPIRPLQHDDGEAYELVEDLLDEFGVVVEAGYVTDLASVPRAMRALVPTAGLHTPAAIRHDKRCDDLNEWHQDGRPNPAPMPSIVADREFLDGVRQLDPNRPLRALVLWAGVRVGAWGNPARRDGAYDDLGRVLLVLLLVAPLYLPVGIVNLAAQTVDGLANRIACRLIRRAVPSRPADAVVA